MKQIAVYVNGTFSRFVTAKQQPREIGGKVLPKRGDVTKVIGGEARSFRVVATASMGTLRGEPVWNAHYVEIPRGG